MTDMDIFEARLSRAYQRYLIDAPTQVDAVALAHSVVTRRLPRFAGWTWPRSSSRALVWMAVLVLAALALGSALVGSAPTPAPIATPSPRPVLQPSGISGPLTVLAISGEEAWVGGVDAGGADAVGHVVGTASSVLLVRTQGAPVADPYPFEVMIQQLLRTQDGSLWATDGGAHDASVLQGTTWTGVGVAAHGIAVDSHGVVWVAQDNWTGWAVHAYALVGNESWVESAKTSETILAARPLHIAIGPDGTVWAGNSGSAVPAAFDGLLRYSATFYPPSANPYDKGEWALVDPLGGQTRSSISDLVVAPNGDVWAAGAISLVSGKLAQPWIARFDGTTWAVFRPAQDLGLASDDPHSANAAPFYSALAIGPDGTVWAASNGGLFRYDGRAWSLPYPGVDLTDVSVADDGTVWAIGPSGLWRLEGPAMSQ